MILAPSPFKKIAEHTETPKTHVEAVETIVEQKKEDIPVVVQAPVVAPVVQPSDCESQLAKYDWNVSIARKVMMQESSNNPRILNNNPRTGDYSIGCFQINIIGGNARTRPSEATLKIAEENVAFAYKLWSSSRTFYGHWPNTCRKVGCE